MLDEYDFSNAIKNPYSEELKRSDVSQSNQHQKILNQDKEIN